MTKTEIKQAITQELNCPADFIKRLNAGGVIDALKAAKDETEYHDIMKYDVYEAWRDYCKAYDVNPETGKPLDED